MHYDRVQGSHLTSRQSLLTLLSDKHQLLGCSDCRTVLYCNSVCQIARRPQHKSACNKIKKVRTLVDKEECRVCDVELSVMTAVSAFKTQAGQVWGIFSMRGHVRARLTLAEEHLIAAGMVNSVSSSLENMRGLLRL
jgi:hypothetical protein